MKALSFMQSGATVIITYKYIQTLAYWPRKAPVTGVLNSTGETQLK